MANALPVASPGQPRRGSEIVRTSPACRPLRELYEWAASSGASSWNDVEARFLSAMSDFDTTLASTVTATDAASYADLAADLQNGKGDFLNDLLALLLERCSGVQHLYTRTNVPGLIIESHNLDGVYPDTGEIGFLLEAKMTGTPRHALNQKQKNPRGRGGSADMGKRIKEFAFKSIDLKGEASRRRAIAGGLPLEGGPGGGDLTTWLHGLSSKIYLVLAARVISDADFNAMVRWCGAATQVVDAVGLYCYEPVDDELTHYRARTGIPVELQLERMLFKACLDLRKLRARFGAA